MKFFNLKFTLIAIILVLCSFTALAAESSELTLTTYSELRLWGEESILPMKIQNIAPYPQEFRIEIDKSVNDWGTYRIEPHQTFMLLPGQTQELYLLLRADNNEFIGLQKFDMQVISSNGDVRVIEMSTNILKPVEKNSSWFVILLTFIGIIIIGVLLIAIALQLINKPSKKQENNTFDELEEFNFEEPKQQAKVEEYNEFDDFDDFDIFDDAESDKVVEDDNKDDEFY